MKMSQRERTLSVVVAVLLVVVFVFVTTLTVFNAFKAKSMTLSTLRSNIEVRNRTIRRGAAALRQIIDYETRGLPSDLDDARSAYLKWLLDVTEEHFGRNTAVVGPSENNARGIYNQLSYTISADGSLKQLTDFLFEFYSINTLHRFKTINVQPIEDTKTLRLTLVVEALAITPTIPRHPDDEPRRELNRQPSNRLAYELADYHDAILNRNLFGPPNQQPRLDSIRPQSATTKRSFSLTLRARDGDEFDRLEYSLGEESPLDATLRPNGDNSARLSWTPPEAGEYSFTVFVKDNGFPAKEDSKTFVVRVSDPKPPPPPTPRAEPPRFDVAKYTVLIGVVEGRDGKPMIMLEEKPFNKKPHQLHEGDAFEIGSVSGKVQEIRIKDVVIEIEGKPMLLTKGETLTDAQPVDQEKTSAAIHGVRQR